MKYGELFNEYISLLSKWGDYIRTMYKLKDGYISKKTISGKQYSYLQKRVNNKLNSEYIREDMLPQVKSELEKRDELEKRINQVNEQLKKIEAAANILDKSLYRKLIVLKRCAVMDSMPADMRRRSLEFGNAMAALEGIPASEDTENYLSLWVEGQNSFKDGYLQILAKYNLIKGVV